jgi:hypothetical protein
MNWYIPGYICYGSENFWLRSLHDNYFGVADATPYFNSVAPYGFHYCFFWWEICVLQRDGIFSNQLISFVLNRFFFSILAMCSFQFNLQSKCCPRHFTASVWDMKVWLMLTAGQWPFRKVKVMCDDLDSLTLIFHFFSYFSIMYKCSWILSEFIAETSRVENIVVSSVNVPNLVFLDVGKSDVYST